jgi:probable F420-dependent oxidoreductase
VEYGIGVGGSLAMVGPMAKMVEDAGFESCWAAETQNSAFITAAAAIQATSRIKVGTSIALAFPRSPTITAMEAADLDELSGGRFIVGLGTQVKRINEERFSVHFEHPAPKLKEYAQVMRTVWAANRGDDVVHEGRFYTVTRPTFGGRRQPAPQDVPIYLAAVGPIMCRTCGEVADGLIAHPIASPRYMKELVKPAVAKGAERAGRKAEDCNITTDWIISIDDDEDRARREVKLQLAFYATTRTYTPILELHGKAEIVPDLRSAFAAKDHDRMIELIDDDLCDEMGIAGPADACREKAEAWGADTGIDRFIVTGPWYGPKPERMMENYTALVETFGSS